ncbi:flavin reductase (NADPH)-like [Homalodisca vitripennis]|uniref:flavin reductase (NADPH)-like n=1 Tax=Homalodisca vitripennis TaxID=197043 RepID=UPI001EEB4226|nr:flavin reductase (NADPH)-like [Homalodisca vitripennis]
MSNIAVFGATGMVGLCVLKAAVEKGLNVQALLRYPNKLPKEYQGKVSYVQGDVFNAEDVRKTLEGQDAAIVVLGTGNSVGSKGLTNVIAGMKELNIKVVSVCLSSNVFIPPEKDRPMFPGVVAEHRKMFAILKDSGLQWIAVNSPYIMDMRPTGYITAHSIIKGDPGVSKYDLGRFFVDCLSMPEHYQKSVGITSKR